MRMSMYRHTHRHEQEGKNRMLYLTNAGQIHAEGAQLAVDRWPHKLAELGEHAATVQVQQRRGKLDCHFY